MMKVSKIGLVAAAFAASSMLVAGCGGGYDIAAAIPLYCYLRQQGKTVILANLSFTRLEFTDCGEIVPGCYRVDKHSAGVPYFPEKFIHEWLSARGESPVIYAFAKTLGVQSLRRAYQYLRERYQLDTLGLAGGRTVGGAGASRQFMPNEGDGTHRRKGRLIQGAVVAVYPTGDVTGDNGR